MDPCTISLHMHVHLRARRQLYYNNGDCAVTVKSRLTRSHCQYGACAGWISRRADTTHDMFGSRSFTLQYLINIDARIEAMHVVVISAWVSSPTLSTVKPNAEFTFLLQLLNFRCTVLHQRCCGKYPALSAYISAHCTPLSYSLFD